VPVIAALLAIALTASLGVWQFSRGAQKQALADSMRQRVAMPAMALLPAPGQTDTAEWLHRLASVRGVWMPQHTVYLENRQIVVNTRARVGFDVVTPLLLADGTALIVQRGWVPRDFSDRSRLPTVSTPTGEVWVQGRYASAPPRLYEFKGAPTSSGALRQNLDVQAYAAEIGRVLRPGSLIQTGDEATLEKAAPEDAMKLERVWTMPDAGVARHHGYAFQWFALSALIAGLLAWFQFILPRRRKR
jgi:surfeit locus 1 family protein